jgi:hypothetical protein
MWRSRIRVSEAPIARAGDVLALRDHEGGRAHQPREDRRVDDGDGERGGPGPRPEDRDDADRQQHQREGEDHVHQPHGDAVGPAAPERRHHAYRAADGERERDRAAGYGERRAVAVEDAREVVAPELVGAEPGDRVGWPQPPHHDLSQRVVRRDPGREQRQRHLERDQRQREGQQPVAAQGGGEAHRRTRGSIAA